MTDITAWLAAANPFHKPADRAQAVRGARWASIALVFGALTQLAGSAWMWFHRETYLAAMRDYMAAMIPDTGAPEAAAVLAMQNAVMSAVPLQQLVFSVVILVVAVILAVVQWRRPNAIIPGIFLGLSVYGFLGAIIALTFLPAWSAMMADLSAAGGAAAPPAPTPEMLGVPAWAMPLNLLQELVMVVLHLAALRGGLSIKRFPTA